MDRSRDPHCLDLGCQLPHAHAFHAPRGLGHVHVHAHAHGASHDRGLLDRLGIGVSITCAVHCVAVGALSLVPSLAASLGGAAGGSLALLEQLELPLLVMAFAIGLWALFPAYRNEHGRLLPIGLFSLGIASLVAGRFVDGLGEIVLTVSGISLIATGHVQNIRYCSAHCRVPSAS